MQVETPRDDAKLTPFTRDHNDLMVGKWDNDILSCLKKDLVPNCLMPTFCPCISIAQIVHRVGIFKYWNTIAISMALFIMYIVFAFLEAYVSKYFVIPMWVVTFLAILLLSMIRQRVRAKFEIPGSVLEDVACSCIFSCCTIGQMAHHVNAYTAGTCAFGPKDTLPGYRES